jgi:hypothetical protein
MAPGSKNAPRGPDDGDAYRRRRDPEDTQTRNVDLGRLGHPPARRLGKAGERYALDDQHEPNRRRQIAHFYLAAWAGAAGGASGAGVGVLKKRKKSDFGLSTIRESPVFRLVS